PERSAPACGQRAEVACNWPALRTMQTRLPAIFTLRTPSVPGMASSATLIHFMLVPKIIHKPNTNCYLCPVFKNSTIHGITVRHRWPTECRQIHLIQLPFQRESTGSQFPILHHRAECGRHYCARRALE